MDKDSAIISFQNELNMNISGRRVATKWFSDFVFYPWCLRIFRCSPALYSTLFELHIWRCDLMKGFGLFMKNLPSMNMPGSKDPGKCVFTFSYPAYWRLSQPGIESKSKSHFVCALF